MRADFLNSVVDPSQAVDPTFDIASPDRFFNRELSWLAFNWRVLEEAQNRRQPLMERVRFLSISASNLDEFYMVRVAGLSGLAAQGVKKVSVDGRTPEQQLVAIDADARALMKKQQELWAGLLEELAEEGVEILGRSSLDRADREYLDAHFLNQVFPVLTPLTIDPAHPFPFIANKGFGVALQLRSRTGGEDKIALIPIPPQVDRFIKLQSEQSNSDAPPRLRFCRLETLIDLHIDRLYPGYDVSDRKVFRVLRDSDIEIEEEAEDLVAMMGTALKRRRRGDVVRLSMEAGSSGKLAGRLIRALEVEPDEVIEMDGILGVSDVSQIIDDKLRPDLCWQSYAPRMPERVRDHAGDVFSAIAEKDMLLHHPYESFEIVVRFLQQAAADPDVVAIRQTLYRTSKESPIVAALVEAAEAGKN
ncbi:MAG: RNA degradosome polyphosphate kinase, partial [Pseudomonadota bacterium]